MSKSAKIEIDYDRRWNSNPMQKPFIQKAIVNICLGEGGEDLEKARSVIEQMTGKTAVLVRAKKSVREWGLRIGQSIATKVTLRGQDAVDFIKRFLEISDNRILRRAFDNKGNFSMGIDEHIKLPGVKYDPDFGIFGFNLSCRIARPGFRVNTRKKHRNKIGVEHYISRKEAIHFMEKVIGVEVVDVMEEIYY